MRPLRTAGVQLVAGRKEMVGGLFFENRKKFPDLAKTVP